MIPDAIVDIARETEVLTAKIKQNLELVERYEKDHQALNDDMKHLNDVAATFAIGYGANIKDVMEMMQVLSRRFKSPEELTYYTNLAMIMYKLDFVSPKQAAQDLEAVILSLGLNFKQSRDFIDQFSIAVHSSRITGSELLAALQRSGASFKAMNMGTKEAISLISGMSTVLAQTGERVGFRFQSILTNIDFKKAAAALKKYNVEVYRANDQGKVVMREGMEIWRDIAKTYNGLKQENEQMANEFANAIAGGKFQANATKALLSNWQEVEKIYNEINAKASPEMTATLLQTGLQTFDTNMKQLTASMQVFGMVLGEQMLPKLKEMVIGLAEGVQWLNEHRTEVHNTISALTKFVEALMLYKGWQFLANTKLGKFILAQRTVVATAPSFAAGMATMSTSVATFAGTVATATMRLLALLVVAVAVGEAYDSIKQAQNERKYLEGLPQGEVDEIQQLIIERDRLADMPGVFNTRKIESLNAKIREKLAEKKSKDSLSDVQKMVDEAMSRINSPQIGGVYDSVTPTIGGDSGSPGGSSGGSGSYSNPPDSSQQRKRIETQAEYKRLLSDMTVTHKQYEEQLDNINSRESLFGKTLASTIDRFDLMKSRVQQLTSEQDNLTSARDKYQELLDEAMESDQEFQEAAQEATGNWSDLTKEQRRAFALTHREGMENFRNIKQLLNYINELNEKIAETSKNTSKMANDLTKDQYGKTLDRDYQYSEHMKYLKDKMNLDKLEATNKFDPLNYLRLNQIELDSLYEQQKEHENKIIDLEEEVNQAIEAKAYELADTKRKLRNQEIMEYAQNAQKIKDLEYQKTAKVKEGLEGITSELIIQGNSWKDIWKRLWNGLAEDALKALFKIQNSTPGLLSSVLGLLGGGKSSGSAFNLSNGQKLDPNFGLFATGGVSRKPAIFGEDGEEVAIPVEKNTQNSGKLLKYAANKLGVSMGTQVVPYLKNPELVNGNNNLSVEVKQNQAHIAELIAQNELMLQQNQMIAAMMSNGNTGGQVVVINTQASASDIAKTIQQNPEIITSLLRQQKSLNRW